MGPEVKGRFVALRLPRRGRRWGQGMGCRIDQGFKRAEDALDFLLAVGDVLLGKVIEGQRLGEREKMFRPVIALERFGNGLWTGCDAVVPILREGMGVALASDDRAEKTHARHAGHITHHVMQVKIHLIQGLLHMLNMLDYHPEQMVAMAEATPELTNVLGRTKRWRKPPITLELLQPSTIKALGFWASRDIFDVAGVAQGHLKAAGLKNLQPRNPVDARRFHHDRRDPTG